MSKMSELSLAASELPTCILVSALLERATETNGLHFCDPAQVAALRDALTYEPFGEALLLSLVLLECERTTPAPDALFYDLLDSQTDEEAAYYYACLDVRDWSNSRGWAPIDAPERLAGWHRTA
jgi:hypothetical protein